METDFFKGLSALLGGTMSFTLLRFFLRGMSECQGLHQKRDDDSEEGAWVGPLELTIVDILVETPDIKTFRLQRSDGRIFPPFEAGQFLTFIIGEASGKVTRSYSLSSSALNHTTVSVSIKKLEGGVGSTWFHQKMPGEKVFTYRPGGHFSDQKSGQGNTSMILVAGGIGITPMYAMILSAIDRASQRPIHLFYGARTQKDLAFHNELTLLSKRYATFHYYPVLSRENSDWEGIKGHITFTLVKDTINEILSSTHFFFCGPPSMTESFIDDLGRGDIDEDHIHFEKFTSPTTVNLDAIPSIEACVQIDGRSLSYSGKKTLLDFLEDHDVPIDSSCRSGVCGNCRCHLAAGKVNALSDSGLTPGEVRDGYILTCVSRPEGDIELALPGGN